MEKIAQMIHTKTFRRGELILRATENHRMLFVIKKGKVKVERLLEDGTEQLLSFIDEGHFFGESTIFHDEPLSINVEALDTTEVCMLDGEQLKNFLLKTPLVLFKIVEHLSNKITVLENRMATISTKEVDARVATFLLEHANDEMVKFNLSKKDIASLLGTTRESVSRKLSQFQKKQFITMEKNQIEIINKAALESIAFE